VVSRGTGGCDGVAGATSALGASSSPADAVVDAGGAAGSDVTCFVELGFVAAGVGLGLR
jgi:hypothetical protein